MSRHGSTFRLLAIFFSVLLGNSVVLAHNGSIAVAYSIAEDIEIDGNFKDWPDYLPVYRVGRVLFGNTLTDKGDCSATFRVAYHASRRRLYLAITVVDNHHFQSVDEREESVAVSLGTRHGLGGDIGSVIGHPRLVPKVESSLFRSSLQIDGARRFYEIELDVARMGPNFVPPEGTPFLCSFTMEIWDRDDDGSYSYLTWSPEVFKMLGPERHGDIMIGADASRMGEVMGQAFPGTAGLCGRTIVRLESTSNQQIFVDVETDEFGGYSLMLPEGHYVRSIPHLPSVPDSAIEVVAAERSQDIINFGVVQRTSVPLRYRYDIAVGKGVPEPSEQLPRKTRTLFRADDGLPDAIVRQFAQSADGTLWLATEKGLYTQDGARVRGIDLPPTTQGRAVAAIPATATGVDGEQIWYGSEDGLSIVTRAEDRIDICERLAGHEVHAISVGHDNRVLVGTNRGLFINDEHGLRVVPSTVDEFDSTVVRVIYPGPSVARNVDRDGHRFVQIRRHRTKEASSPTNG